MNLMPPYANRIHYSTMVSKQFLHRAKPELLDQIRNDVAHNCIRHILEKCITERESKNDDAIVYEINAVVLTQEEYEDSLRNAYNEGRASAARLKFP